MSALAPLTGADAFLLAMEHLMLRHGQGQHLGFTQVRLGPGFDLKRFREACARVASVSPLATARVEQPLFQIPRWRIGDETPSFPIQVHEPNTDPASLGEARLNTPTDRNLSFDVIPQPDGGTTLLVCWRHLVLDGKGIELLLAEIARLAADPAAEPRTQSWGVVGERSLPWREFLGEMERFKNRFYENAAYKIGALSGSEPKPGRALCEVVKFSAEETAQISALAAAVSRGVFQLAWFLAAVTRAHRAVFLHRGSEPESYQTGCPVQQRKRGTRHPIWQNQVSQLFFRLLPAEATDLAKAAEILQEQFATQTRERLDLAFSSMASILRRLPTPWYLRFLRSNSGGYITSFFYSHTGNFLPECDTLAGAPVLEGWHVPSISAPPGTGLFFSERSGALTATLSWREGVLTDEERALLWKSLREDLLGS